MSSQYQIVLTATEALGTVTQWCSLSPLSGAVALTDSPALIDGAHEAERVLWLTSSLLDTLSHDGYLLTVMGPLGAYHSSYRGVAGGGIRELLEAAQATAVRTAVYPEGK